MGQFLSSRSDICAPPVCKALSRLFDRMPPMAPDVVCVELEKAFGASVETLFDDINLAKPLGTASVAQVHAATLRPAAVPGDASDSDGEAVGVAGRPPLDPPPRLAAQSTRR